MTSFLEQIKINDHYLYLNNILESLNPTNNNEEDFINALFWAIKTIEEQAITISKIDQACKNPDTITARNMIKKSIQRKHLKLAQ